MDNRVSRVVLMADDDPDDRFVVKEAFREIGISQFRFVEDGEQLLDYLCHKGKFSDPKLAPPPSFILLDLNMPKKDGREALAEIKAAPDLSVPPIVIFTTSDDEDDREFCRKAGASDYLVKPNSYDALVKTLDLLVKRWHSLSLPV